MMVLCSVGCGCWETCRVDVHASCAVGSDEIRKPKSITTNC